MSWWGCAKLHQLARTAEQAPEQFPLEPTAPALSVEVPRRIVPPPVRPVATLALAGTIAGVFFLQLLWGATGDGIAGLVRMGALVGARVQAGELWRLGSCTRLHADLLHVALNLLVLATWEGIWNACPGARVFCSSTRRPPWAAAERAWRSTRPSVSAPRGHSGD